MHESRHVNTMWPEEPSSQQHPVPPDPTSGQPSFLKKALAGVVDRFRPLFAKCADLIKSRPWIAGGTAIGLVAAVTLGVWQLHRSETTEPTNSRAAQIQGRATAARRQKEVPGKKAAPTVSFRAYHLHSDKAPAKHGPYCLGILSANGHHLKFSGRSASRGQRVHKFDFACSNVREIKKNARIASRQGGFHVRTASAGLNFAPRDSSPKHISALASACSN